MHTQTSAHALIPFTFHEENFMFHFFPSLVEASDEKSIAETSGIWSRGFLAEVYKKFMKELQILEIQQIIVKRANNQKREKSKASYIVLHNKRNEDLYIF